ncbi:autotransporter assembly complex family protein [Aquamicrobium segne]|uniref:Autotransporter assembly complex family protein n=1 Tax=Aquamicrobium segne TaxID=469547 RepID=A0ABW0H0P8_9HYPH
MRSVLKHKTDKQVAAGNALSRALLLVLLAGTTLTVAPQPASAFELFGIKLWGTSDSQETDIVDPMRYTVTINVPDDFDELKKRLEAASSLKSGEERPVSGSLGLMSRARGDRESLIAALYADARYEGVVEVLIDGRSIDELPPDTEFTDAQPIPVVVEVMPGPKFTLGNIRLEGDTAGLASADFGLISGGEAGSGAILKAEALIVRALKEEGRPLAEITDREIVADHNSTTLDVSLTVKAGPVAGYGETTVAGTERMDPEFTRYMAGLKRGARYSPEEMDAARERLLGLEVFNSVTLREAEALDANGDIPIGINVAERKTRYLGIGGTVSNTDGLGIEGYWGHRNLFGRAEKLRVEGSISGIGSNDISKLNYNAGIMFEKPGVVGPASKFFSSLKAVYEHPDAYDRFSVKGSAGLSYQIGKYTTVSGEFSLDYSKITDPLNNDTKNYLIASTPLQYVYDRRDNLLNPTKGYRLLAFVEPSYDTLNAKAFVKIKGEGSAYYAPMDSNRFVLAGRVAAGSILGASLADIPADRRFYAGGGGSVRGYSYQGIGPKDPLDNKPTGGLSWFETSAELRIALTDTIGVVPFVDAATVSNKQFPEFSDIKVGAGIGLRYLTPFGPLRIDAAVPLNRERGDPRYGIYAGIGQAF